MLNPTFVGREETELVASGPFSLGPSAQGSRGRSFAAPTGQAVFSHDTRTSLAADADGYDINAMYGFNADPMAPMAVPNQSTMETWEKEKLKKKKEKKPAVSDEQKFEDANGDVKGKIPVLASYCILLNLMPTTLFCSVKVEDEANGMEGVVSTSEQTPSENMDVDGIAETEDVSSLVYTYFSDMINNASNNSRTYRLKTTSCTFSSCLQFCQGSNFQRVKPRLQRQQTVLMKPLSIALHQKLPTRKQKHRPSQQPR